MSVTFEREALLRQLEIISPGISNKDIVEQSSCVVFRDGYAMSFNDEVSCRVASDIELSGAIHAQTLIECLRKLKEDVLQIEEEDTQIIIKGKNKRIGVARNNEILLNTDAVGFPQGWSRLPDDFSDAIEMVVPCAGKDQHKFATTMVHMTQKYVEATDSLQIGRYYIDMPFDEDTKILIRASTLKMAIPFGFTKISFSDSWVHLRNNALGMFMSLRQYENEVFPSTDVYMSQKGVAVDLPRVLADAADLAEVFSQQNPDKNEITIKLKDGRIIVRGEGVSGWSEEKRKIKYSGPDMEFRTVPKLLKAIVTQHNKCHICDSVLRVKGDKYTYVSALSKRNEEK